MDAEDDPGAVTNYFTRHGVEHQGYGNGISFMNFILGPYYRYTLPCPSRLGVAVHRLRRGPCLRGAAAARVYIEHDLIPMIGAGRLRGDDPK